MGQERLERGLREWGAITSLSALDQLDLRGAGRLSGERLGFLNLGFHLIEGRCYESAGRTTGA